jgi:hypothetical protein
VYKIYQNNKPVPTAGRSTFSNALRKLFLLFITIPLLYFARAQAPHISSFQPTSAGQGDTVLISGTHFDSLLLVSFGGVNAHSFTALSDSVIWTTVGTGATGKVMVVTRHGLDSLGGFTYIPRPPSIPQITSFIPDSARQHDTVLIRGHLFTGATGVSFGGIPALSYHVITDSAIWAVVGNGASGNVTVSRSPYSGSLGGFVFIAPPVVAPHILSFSPDSARRGDTVTIRGTHFTGVTAVSFGGLPALFFSVRSDSLIWATVGAGASGYVKVTHSPYSDSLSGFIYVPTTPPSIPQVTSFIPDSARQNDTVLIRGHRFTGATGVSFGGVPALYFHVITDSAVWAVVGNGASGSVTVSHSPYSGSLGGFTFIASVVAPHILSFSPDSARRGDTVTIRGTHFTGVTAVSFGGVAAQSFTVLSDTLIWTTVGTGASGYVNVIHFPYSDSLGGFIFIAPPPAAPHLISFFPDSARQRDTVSLVGTHLSSVITVSFGGISAGSFTIVSDSLIRAIVGAGASGNVKVATAQASDSLGGFTFISSDTTTPPPPPPAGLHILSFSPDSARQGDSVTIFGQHFDSVIAVSFGGVPAQSFTILSDSLIRAIVGAGASGNVKVATAQASDSLGGFRFISSDTTTPPPPPPSSFKLVSFTGSSASGHVTLSWSVQFDQSIFFYSVEHSTDTVSSHFVSVGGVAAQKLDSANYTFTDTATRTGVNYYRLRIVDSVGNTAFSGTFAIDLGNIPGTLSLYPNPAIGRIFVAVPTTWLPSKFLLADAAGQVVLTMPVSAGVQQVIIPVGRFNKGVYKLMWTNGQNTAIRTILILK